MTPELHRGDVWWAAVPGDKTRPVVILTRAHFLPHLANILVAPITTTVRSIPTEVPLGMDDGLPRSCAANFDNLFTLDRSRFEQFIGRLGDAQMGEVCRAYRFAAGC